MTRTPYVFWDVGGIHGQGDQLSSGDFHVVIRGEVEVVYDACVEAGQPTGETSIVKDGAAVNVEALLEALHLSAITSTPTAHKTTGIGLRRVRLASVSGSQVCVTAKLDVGEFMKVLRAYAQQAEDGGRTLQTLQRLTALQARCTLEEDLATLLAQHPIPGMLQPQAQFIPAPTKTVLLQGATLPASGISTLYVVLHGRASLTEDGGKTLSFSEGEHFIVPVPPVTDESKAKKCHQVSSESAVLLLLSVAVTEGQGVKAAPGISEDLNDKLAARNEAKLRKAELELQIRKQEVQLGLRKPFDVRYAWSVLRHGLWQCSATGLKFSSLARPPAASAVPLDEEIHKLRLSDEKLAAEVEARLMRLKHLASTWTSLGSPSPSVQLAQRDVGRDQDVEAATEGRKASARTRGDAEGSRTAYLLPSKQENLSHQRLGAIELWLAEERTMLNHKLHVQRADIERLYHRLKRPRLEAEQLDRQLIAAGVTQIALDVVKAEIQRLQLLFEPLVAVQRVKLRALWAYLQVESARRAPFEQGAGGAPDDEAMLQLVTSEVDALNHAKELQDRAVAAALERAKPQGNSMESLSQCIMGWLTAAKADGDTVDFAQVQSTLALATSTEGLGKEAVAKAKALADDALTKSAERQAQQKEQETQKLQDCERWKALAEMEKEKRLETESQLADVIQQAAEAKARLPAATFCEVAEAVPEVVNAEESDEIWTEAAATALYGQCVELWDMLGTPNDQRTALQLESANLEDVITGLESCLANLRPQAASLQQEVGSLEEEVSRLHGILGIVSSSQPSGGSDLTLQQQKDELAQKQLQLEECLEARKAQMATLEQRCIEVWNRVSTPEDERVAFKTLHHGYTQEKMASAEKALEELIEKSSENMDGWGVLQSIREHLKKQRVRIGDIISAADDGNDKELSRTEFKKELLNRKIACPTKGYSELCDLLGFPTGNKPLSFTNFMQRYKVVEKEALKRLGSVASPGSRFQNAAKKMQNVVTATK